MTDELKQQRIYQLTAEIRGLSLTKSYYEKYLNDYVSFKDSVNSLTTTINSAKESIDDAKAKYKAGGFTDGVEILGQNLTTDISLKLGFILEDSKVIIKSCSDKIEEYRVGINNCSNTISAKQSELNSLRYY